MWHHIHRTDPVLYIWTHELLHAWVAKQLGGTNIRMRVWIDGGRVKGRCNYDGKLPLTDQSKIVAAPAVFFHGKTIDSYLMTEREEARKLLAEAIGHSPHLGEFVSLVVNPVRKILPSDDDILHIAKRHRDEFVCKHPGELMFTV